MFSIHIVNVCQDSLRCIFKQTVRNARITTRRATKKRRENDPGVRLQAGLLAQESKLAAQDLDEMEADFISLGMSHKDHMQQVESWKDKEKHLIVQRKYFKENTPNFLTWSDKQQIRYLFNTDSEEWTVDKLVEGFPATQETIMKIVKSNWVKKNENKIINHDESVQANWSLFKEGKMQDLPPSLAEHLQKFTNRELNLKPFEIQKDLRTETPKCRQYIGEFSEIINSYKNLKNKSYNTVNSIPEENNRVSEKRPLKDSYLLTKSNDFVNKKLENSRGSPQNYRQAEMKDKAEAMQNNKEKSLPEERNGVSAKQPLKETYLLAKPEDFVNKKPVTLRELEKNSDVPAHYNSQAETQEKAGAMQKVVDVSSITKYESNKGSLLKLPKDYAHLSYPERITIPKEKLKRGCTYKLNDCYYDDDGEFLYRVPGMV